MRRPQTDPTCNYHARWTPQSNKHKRLISGSNHGVFFVSAKSDMIFNTLQLQLQIGYISRVKKKMPAHHLWCTSLTLKPPQMKIGLSTAYLSVHYVEMVPFWKYGVVKLMQLNGLQAPSSPSSQTSFSPSSDNHSDSKNQPVGLISVPARSKVCTGFILHHLTTKYPPLAPIMQIRSSGTTPIAWIMRRDDIFWSQGRSVFWKS